MSKSIIPSLVAFCLCMGINSAALADVVTVSVNGTIAEAPPDLPGVQSGTPFQWTATYDTSIASALMPYRSNVSEAFAALTTHLTIGTYSWDVGNLYMAISCCSSIPSAYYDSVFFYGSSFIGSTVQIGGQNASPHFLYAAFEVPANVLSSTNTPTAEDLTKLPFGNLDLTLDSPSGQFDIRAFAATSVTITSSVPEPGTVVFASMGFCILALFRWRPANRGQRSQPQ